MMNKNELDKKGVLELLESDSQFLDINIWEINEELRDDPEIVLAFARKTRNASVIQYAGNNLRNNKDFLLEIARCDENGYDMGLAIVLSRAGEEVKGDKAFFVELLKQEGSLYRYIGDTLKEDSDLKLISAISNMGNKFYNGARVLSFEDKVNEFLSRVKNGISVQGEAKNRPYSFRVELENYELNKNFRPGIEDEIKEESVFVQESPEEIERQIALLENIKEITSNREKEGQTKSPLQQREKSLVGLESIDEASKKLLALELELSKIRDDRESVKQEQKRIIDLMDKMADEYLAHGFVVTLEDEEYLELRNQLLEAEAKEEYIEGLIDTKQQEYEQSESEFVEFAKSKGHTIVSNADFVLDVKPEFIKKSFLEHHITDFGVNSRETFEKLVELYGEDYLSNLVVSEYEENEYADEEYAEEDAVEYKRTIEDFISGEEDKLIGLVNNDILRRKMLASKLQRLDSYETADIRQYIQEYVEEASSNGVKYSVFEDEFGYVDFDDTIANFSMLPISNDKNFYLFLAKYLKEMNIPLETYVDYIPQDFIDDKFGSELANVVNTGEYSYQMRFEETSEGPVSSELLAWLEGKEDELSAEEKTKKTIDETKALLAKQAEKTGEQK